MDKWVSMWSIGPCAGKETMEKIKAGGFAGVEVWGEHEGIFETINHAKAAGLQIGCHLPFSGLNLADADDAKAAKAVSVLENLLRHLGECGCRHAVLHGGTISEKNDKPISWQKVVARLKKLQQQAASAQVNLLLENLIPSEKQTVIASNVSDWLYLIEETGVDACLDVGHLQIAGEPLQSAFTRLNKHIKAVHYSENDGKQDLHLMAQQGTSYLSELMDMLKKVKYKNTFTFEVHPSHYTLEDIMQVAREVN